VSERTLLDRVSPSATRTPKTEPAIGPGGNENTDISVEPHGGGRRRKQDERSHERGRRVDDSIGRASLPFRLRRERRRRSTSACSMKRHHWGEARHTSSIDELVSSRTHRRSSQALTRRELLWSTVRRAKTLEERLLLRLRRKGQQPKRYRQTTLRLKGGIDKGKWDLPCRRGLSGKPA
jgi:hypothetical protein